MAGRTVSVELSGSGLHFIATTGSGHQVALGGEPGDAGVGPTELIPIALAGCSAMDVISILRKKRQPVDRYEVRATGSQRGERPHAFTSIDLLHIVEGEGVELEAVRRAIELSATRYCPVGATLASGITVIRHSYLVRDSAGRQQTAEVITVGPRSEPGAG